MSNKRIVKVVKEEHSSAGRTEVEPIEDISEPVVVPPQEPKPKENKAVADFKQLYKKAKEELAELELNYHIDFKHKHFRLEYLKGQISVFEMLLGESK